MTVHLARKWRSKNFNELIGQDLSVRLLKNSLFKKTFFPAYLFSGLRGSGKTSMGRIFAAAVNCLALDSFIAQPQSVVIPCGDCVSCRAVYSGQHPDFIEIDAASHTGVDNMRLIIENASLLPVLGRKKIYLIDEAHMLSKAAFNAALKILEEPPLHVMFILATTDPEKIIETIKSRCFQIFFDPIPSEIIAGHLKNICDAEHIIYDNEGLHILAEQSSGSARDALTTLERIVLSEGHVTHMSVHKALGLVEKSVIHTLYTIIVQKDPGLLSDFLQEHKKASYHPMVLWRSITDYISLQLYDQKNINQPDVYSHLMRALRISYESEILLHKTAVQRSVVEYMLFRMCFIPLTHQTLSSGALPLVDSKVSDNKISPVAKKQSDISLPHQNPLWQAFLQSIVSCVEPLVATLFNAAQVDYISSTQRCKVMCLKEHEIFKEWLDSSAHLWKPLVHQAFNAPVELDIEFTLMKERTVISSRSAVSVPDKKNDVKTGPLKTSENISKALKIFPGTIQEVK